MEQSMTGKVHKRVLVDSPLPPEPLLRLPEVTAAPDSPTFFIVGLVALCVLVLLLCLLIAFMTYRLITQRKKEQAYRSKRFRSPIFRPVVETMVSAKISNHNQKTHPTALTIETEVNPSHTSHQPLNNLNKCQRMSTPKLTRYQANVSTSVKCGVMNITASPFQESSDKHGDMGVIRDFGSQNLSPLESQVQFKFYHKLQGHLTNQGHPAVVNKQVTTKSKNLYTLAFDTESDCE